MMKWVHQCRGVSSYLHHLSDVCCDGLCSRQRCSSNHTPESSSWRTEDVAATSRVPFVVFWSRHLQQKMFTPPVVVATAVAVAAIGAVAAAAVPVRGFVVKAQAVVVASRN